MGMHEIKNHWLAGARRALSPNQDLRPITPDQIDLVVIHGISLPPSTFGGTCVEEFFCNTLDFNAHPYFQQISTLQVSAHLFIDREGAVTQFVPFDRRAWHAGQSCYEGRTNCNDFSIGIELEGTDETPYTEAQYEKLAAITRGLLKNYRGLSTKAIVGHSDIAPGRKTDPGPFFDWDRFRKLLPHP